MSTCLCDTRETHPTSECVAPWETTEEVQQADLRALLLATGLPLHARPYSAHAVIHRELLPALRALLLPDCPTRGVCPHCREGWGHLADGRYSPTEQSRAANAKNEEMPEPGSPLAPHDRQCETGLRYGPWTDCGCLERSR